ncbi:MULTISPECIES: NADPH-dependent FMN reductase [Streptomyces]|uniref:NAD(P)H-dependent oxidoreductase n=1 Tax=Streptomyces flaveolus TaxID=67297 RepID=A0ABV3AHE3_9ACTN|nr:MULTISPECIES: NAD(P)H-dependent oxidoreductase [Streptomyces]KMS88031.1 NADPH-dependent FMN reductase [Streptomyces regensis]
MTPLNVLALSGSLRRSSLNTTLLREAERLCPQHRFDHYDGLGRLPHFNEDQEHPAPSEVIDLRRRVREADAVLIASPEYNASVPGALKNALDWLSRPAGEDGPALALKPVAVIGASPGPFGTVRAQLALRQVLHKMNAHVVQQPEFLLFQAHQQLGDDGRLPDGSPAQQLLCAVLDALARLATRERRQAPTGAAVR